MPIQREFLYFEKYDYTHIIYEWSEKLILLYLIDNKKEAG